MHDHCSYGDLLCSSAYPLKGIVEQGRAKPLFLTALVDGEAGEDRHRNWKVPREALAHRLGRLGMLKLAGYERVVAARHAMLIDGNKGASSVASLALACVEMQPAVE